MTDVDNDTTDVKDVSPDERLPEEAQFAGIETAADIEVPDVGGEID